MYAVVKTGGKQYRVEEGQEILVEKIVGNPGDKIRLEDVLLVKTEEETIFGERAKKAIVEAEIIGHEKGEKVVVFKYRPKKRYRRKTGHRQLHTRLKIFSLTFGDKKVRKAEEVVSEETAIVKAVKKKKPAEKKTAPVEEKIQADKKPLKEKRETAKKESSVKKTVKPKKESTNVKKSISTKKGS